MGAPAKRRRLARRACFERLPRPHPPAALRRALGIHVQSDLFPRAAAAFRKFMVRAATEQVGEALLEAER